MNLPIAKQRGQVIVEPIDPCNACAVDTARVLAREGSSGRMDETTRERRDALKGASHQLAHQNLFATLWRENKETKTQARERRQGTVKVRAK